MKILKTFFLGGAINENPNKKFSDGNPNNCFSGGKPPKKNSSLREIFDKIRFCIKLF
jgi:hypothetical protein